MRVCGFRGSILQLPSKAIAFWLYWYAPPPWVNIFVLVYAKSLFIYSLKFNKIIIIFLNEILKKLYKQ